MRSYTNKQGEVITVSKEHLDTAVRIKKELQKDSPSRRCSWSMLVKLMAKEGFENAENSESYRCLIKNHQKSIGELPEVTTYADMVADSKLASIKEIVGDLRYEKEDNKKVLREVNKGVRKLIDFGTIAEQIGQAFSTHDFNELKPFVYDEKEVNNSTSKKIIVVLTDLHIGAVVKNNLNTYNYEVAKERLQNYLNKIIDECILYGIEEVSVVNLGDVVEHSQMRHSNAYGIEFPLSEQIVKATDLIIKFLIGLSEHVNVSYAGIAGNHDRIEGNKDKALDSDHVVKSINYSIEMFIENAEINNIKYEQADDYGYNKEFNGVNVKFLHGDLDNIKDDNLIGKHSTLDEMNYSLILTGHIHHFTDREVGINKRVVSFGSLKGADDYGKRIRKISSPSQGIAIIHEDGEIEIKKINVS